MAEELVGQKVGGYEVLDVIGRGGMAVVYRAQQVSMNNRQVALKVLPRQFATDDTYLQRFNREVNIISQLEHRNIVPVYDYGQHEGQPYIVMRYMSGGSVDDLLAQGPLTVEQMVAIIAQIAPALDYAHGKNVLHRDIKPSNVLLDDDGGAYLTDFGIARIVGEGSSISNITTQGVVGTPSYMSPEQAQGHEVDARSDIYSLGIMLFEMATGRRPFESDTPYSIAVMQVTQPPPAPRSLNPAVSPMIEQVIYKALNKRPQDRYRSVMEFADAVERAAQPAYAPQLMPDTQPGGIQIPAHMRSQQPPAYAPSASNGLPPARRRARRPNNLVLSAAVGGLLGCGLLALVLVGVLLIVSNAQREEQQALAQTLTGAAPTASADGDSIANGDEPGALPTELPGIAATGIAPVGLRATPLPGSLPDAEIVYFALRGRNYDVYRRNFSTGADIRLTTHEATDMYPQVSPDGRRIVFVSNRDGDFEVFVIDINGDNLRQVTSNAVVDRIPSWSPDGRWIIFSSDTRGNGSHDLYQVRPDGSELTLIYSDGKRNSHPRWSADDRYIIFTGGLPEDETTWEIMRLDRRSGEVIALTNNNHRDSSPTFTPDGRAILYTTRGDGGAAIAQMSLDGEDSRIVYDGAGEEWGASYSADMRYILFTSNPTGADELYLYDLDLDDVQQLTFNSGMYADWLSYVSG
jgi:serine/threonine-protein kinase